MVTVKWFIQCHDLSWEKWVKSNFTDKHHYWTWHSAKMTLISKFDYDVTDLIRRKKSITRKYKQK